MKRTVLLSRKAKRQIVDIANWWSEHRSSLQAERWLTSIHAAIDGLQDTADRYPPAPEAALMNRGLRQMAFGLSGKPTHRVVFEIQGAEVLVFAVRHVAQDDLAAEDID